MMYRKEEYRDHSPVTKKKRTKDSKGNKKISKQSLAYSRRKIIELGCCNKGEFKSFITLTYAQEMEDYKKAYKDLKVFLEQVRRQMKKEGLELKYLGVPEIQTKRAEKTGKYVIHFHLFTNITLGSNIIPKRKVKRIKDEISGKYYSVNYYNIKYWRHGYSRAKEIKNEDNGFNAGKYLLKYMCKGFDDRFFGYKKVLASRNLNKKKVIYTKDIDNIEDFKRLNNKNLKSVYKSDYKNSYISNFEEFEYKYT